MWQFWDGDYESVFIFPPRNYCQVTALYTSCTGSAKSQSCLSKEACADGGFALSKLPTDSTPLNRPSGSNCANPHEKKSPGMRRKQISADINFFLRRFFRIFFFFNISERIVKTFFSFFFLDATEAFDLYRGTRLEYESYSIQRSEFY